MRLTEAYLFYYSGRRRRRYGYTLKRCLREYNNHTVAVAATTRRLRTGHFGCKSNVCRGLKSIHKQYATLM